MRRYQIYLSLVMVIGILYACNKKEPLPSQDQIKFEQPTNFPKPVYQFEGNTLTNKGFELGKKLFYDPKLSANGTVSCGSCHQQFAGFAQLDHPLSHGVNNCLGKRNAPTLFNLAWQNSFFWDGGAKNLEIVPLNAITDECEMGSNLKASLEFLNHTAPYPEMFKAVFGTQTIDSQHFLRALTQFVAAMVSANSKYDLVKREPSRYSFTDDEKAGYQVFKDNCGDCHTEPLFTNNDFADNGLATTGEDLGRQTITGLASDYKKFKIPTLRNIELSSPYMHDGRFNTLEKVLAHYDSGVTDRQNLHPLLRKNGDLGVQLSPLQKTQLISFLKTLTDHDFIKNKAFSEF